MYHEQNWYEASASPKINQASSPAPKQKQGFGKKNVALALACALIGGLTGVGGTALMDRLPHDSTIREGQRVNTVINVSQVDTGRQLTAAEVYAANVNSTVGITTSAVTTNFWGVPVSSAAAGSGFIFSDDGYILTNYHVHSHRGMLPGVEGGASRRTGDGAERGGSGHPAQQSADKAQGGDLYPRAPDRKSVV